MRLTNRGRVACGVLATGLVLASQSAYSALSDGPPAGAAGRHDVAATTPRSAPPSSTPPAVAAAPTGGPRQTVAVMDRDSDDLPVTAAPAPQPTSSSVPSRDTARQSGNGRLSTVPGTTAAAGKGPLRRYRVHIEGGVRADAAAFAAAVQRTLSDQRSWGAQWSFQRVDSGPVSFSVVLASPTLAQQLCQPLDIRYRLSCYSAGRSVINLARWRDGADAYAGKLAAYRQYVINHEVGHALGHGHEPCRGAGTLAPVMMQQTKGIGACRANPWPYPGA